MTTPSISDLSALREVAEHPGAQYLAEQLQAAYDKVKEWPENSETGFMDLLTLRNLVPDAIALLTAEKARADAAEAAYRLERDQVVAALRAIESMCPATQEMTLAHAMADLARDTLTDIGAE